MRFFLRFSLIKGRNINNHFHPPYWIEERLPVKFRHSDSQFSLNSFTYAVSKPSIVEKNWGKPYFENENYLLFIAGSVYYRLAEKDVQGDYVPEPETIFNILLADKHEIYNRLKGHFYLVLFDKQSNKVEIFSAPFAIYPAWYTVHEGVLFVSNILESIVKVKESVDFDSRGLFELSLFDHCLNDRTIYKNVFMLEGGKTLFFEGQKISKRLDYDICQWFSTDPLNKKKSLDKIDYSLKRHIGEFRESSKYYNASLTGGYDSRLNLAYIPESDYHRMQTMSYGKPGSNQHQIPDLIAGKLGFQHKTIGLDNEFVSNYHSLGLESILYTGGITPFFRAMYPYAYGEVAKFSRSFMLGQCDMIRPLSMAQPAGAIYNDFNWNIFFGKGREEFESLAINHKKQSYIDLELLADIDPGEIYDDVVNEHISPYENMDIKTKFWFFLYKESMLKFWHTECHLVDVFVNDFISFSDLDFIEALTASKYAGLYKGLLEKSNLKRLGAHDLYVDLMTINNNKLNNIISDRYYKPKWYKYLPLGYAVMAAAKYQQIGHIKKGNDTFSGKIWHDEFINEHYKKLIGTDSFIQLDKNPYTKEVEYRKNRFISLKVWLSLLSDTKPVH